MVDLAPDHAGGHFVAALTAARDFARFRRAAATVIALNPDAEIASDLQGHLCLVNEVPLEAIPHFERCMRLDPSLGKTLACLQFLGWASFYAGRYETAAALFRERILLMPATDVSLGKTLAGVQFLGKASFYAGRNETAAALFRDRILLMPPTRRADTSPPPSATSARSRRAGRSGPS